MVSLLPRHCQITPLACTSSLSLPVQQNLFRFLWISHIRAAVEQFRNGDFTTGFKIRDRLPVTANAFIRMYAALESEA